MKAIVLAGGTGTRLYPTTLAVNKQLLPVYDKPTIYYPISTLIQQQIYRFIIVCASYEQQEQYSNLLNGLEKLGLQFEYALQKKPKGIADAYKVCEPYLKNQDYIPLILGDNIFHNLKYKQASFPYKNTIFSCYVSNPSAYGVLKYKKNQVVDIVEKPKNPPSSYAVPGFYIFNSSVFDYVKKLKPSARGELEITDLARVYLKEKQLEVFQFDRDTAWFDTGTAEFLHDASDFVRTLQLKTNTPVGSIEYEMLQNNAITKNQLLTFLSDKPENNYTNLLRRIANE